MALLEIGAACVKREKESAKPYGRAADVLLNAMRKKGDLNSCLVMEAEKKRFTAEGTVPDGKDAIPVLGTAVQAYHKLEHGTAMLLFRRLVCEPLQKFSYLRREEHDGV